MVSDDIPLIDDSHSIDEVSLLVEKIKTNRPNFLHGNSPASGFYFNPLGLDSPDIFKLRAPLVSHSQIIPETFLTKTTRKRIIISFSRSLVKTS